MSRTIKHKKRMPRERPFDYEPSGVPVTVRPDDGMDVVRSMLYDTPEVFAAMLASLDQTIDQAKKSVARLRVLSD